MDSEGLSCQIAEEEKALKVMNNAHEVVEQQKLNYQRQILELQLAKKDVEIVLSKSKNSLDQKKIEIKLLTRRFWHEKNSGN